MGTRSTEIGNELMRLFDQQTEFLSKTAASATPYAGHTGPRLLLLMLDVAWPSLPATK